MRRLALTAAAALLVIPVAVSAPESGDAAPAVVKTAFNAKLKRAIVVDGKGRTLYMFTADIGGKPNCAAVHPACPRIWPAYTSAGAPRAGKGIKASLLGVTKGAGGVRQVTYNRHPLYYFAGGSGTGTGDKLPGHVRGQGVHGTWYVLAPAGIPIRK